MAFRIVRLACYLAEFLSFDDCVIHRTKPRLIELKSHALRSLAALLIRRQGVQVAAREPFPCCIQHLTRAEFKVDQQEWLFRWSAIESEVLLCRRGHAALKRGQHYQADNDHSLAST